jgi:hypothetical protein
MRPGCKRVESRLEAPEAVEVMDLGDRLRITRRWFYWTSVPLGLVALVWLGLTLCKFADDLLNACNLQFQGLGLWVLQIAVLTLVNRHEIEVDREKMTVWHGPLPSLSRNRTVPVRDINQLLLKTIRMSGNLSGTDRYWAVYTVDRFGDKRELLGAMPDWEQAEYIRQEIEHFP